MSAPRERAKAKAEGHKVYFTGRPCKYGHVAERETISGACTVCRLERGRLQEAANREERLRKNRDRKRVKHQDNPEAQAERREKFRAWKRRKDEPKSISLAAYEGVGSEVEGLRWIHEQAARLFVSAETIIGAIRLRWTLIEIEKLSRDDAEQLSKSVHEVKPGDGFVRWENYDPALNVGEIS